jgi:hypothetical protein
MKQTRLLEIIREEIAGTLNEAGLGDQITALDKQIEAATKQIAPLQKKLADLQGKKADLQKKEADLSTKTQAQLEEDQLNERPFIDSAFDVTGTSPENLNQDSLQKTIDDAVKVLQQEYPDADVKKLAGELQKVNSAKNLGPNSKLSPEVKSALQKVADVIEKQGQIFGSPSKIDDLMKLAKDPSQIDRLEKLKSKGYTFILGNPQAVTAIEKSLGLKPKNNDSLLADKSKTEKPKTEKSPKSKAEKAPKAKAATRTKGDDGFDNVSYSDGDDEDKEATQNVGSDSTAKELGKEADVSKNPDFDRIRKGLQNKRKNSKDGILSPEDMKLAINIINTAKDKYKFNTTQVDSLRADIGL